MAMPTQNMQSSKKAHCTVPIVTIGVNRDTALATEKALINLDRSNYHVVACLDFVNSPEAYQFSPRNLGVVLHALHPRPKGLITGTAVKDDELSSIKEVWDAYVENVIIKEKLGGHCWVALSKWHATTGPPPSGWDEEIVRQLDAVFL